MEKNKLADLNNHLFASLERLSDKQLKGEELKEELHRAKHINATSKEIVSLHTAVLETAKFVAKGSIRVPELANNAGFKHPYLLSNGEKE